MDKAADDTNKPSATSGAGDSSNSGSSGSVARAQAAAEAKERRQELDARVKLLEEHADGYKDPGPMVHCVAWHDGQAWRAALDTTELFEFMDPEGKGGQEGRLADCTPMTNFRCASHGAVQASVHCGGTRSQAPAVQSLFCTDANVSVVVRSAAALRTSRHALSCG